MLAVGAVLCTAPLGRSTAGTTTPRTVLTIPGVIRSFAFGPQRLAWIEATWELRIRRLATGKTTTTRYTNQHFEGADPSLVFSGSRPVWLGERGIYSITDRVFTTTPAGQARAVEKVVHTTSNGGFVTGISGDPTGGVYGVAILHDTSGTGAGPYDLAGGGVWTVGNGVSHRVPHLPPPAYLSRAGKTVALVPMAETTPGSPGQLTPTDTGTIAALPSGSTLSTLTVSGTVEALALSQRFLFVLVTDGTATSIEIHDARTGKLLRRVSAPRISRLAPKLSAAGPWVVYHDQRTVSALNGATGRVTRVATTNWLVRQAAIQGTTVAWSEQKGGGSETVRANYTSRLRELTLP
jgi:hypothetical protein